MINEKIAELHSRYIGKYGAKPKRIYLGVKQKCELKNICHYKVADDSNMDIENVFGMDIYWVDADDHIFVAGVK